MIINGNLILYNSWAIESLGEIKEVKGNLDLSNCKNLTSLGNLEKVTGDLLLWNCKSLNDLGKLKEINGNLSTIGSGITQEYLRKYKPYLVDRNYWRK